jgi:phenylacetate-CoA ligase
MDQRGITVRNITSLEDIKRFPILTKKDVRRAGNSLVSQKYNKWFLHTAYTGGTTAVRLPLKRNPVSIGNEHAFVRRQFDWAGITMRNHCAYMTWRTVAKPNENSGKYYAYEPLTKELILSTFHLSENVAKTYVEAMLKYHVKALVAYPSAAFVLAKAILSADSFLPLASVLTTSETLGENEKAIISKAFQCPVYDFYGSAERLCYIHTCEKLCYHIIPEYGLTELLPAEACNDDCRRIIATGFWNTAMPLIRYDTADLLKTGDQPCQCGRAFPTVKKIIGCDSGFITTSSGRTIGQTAMARLFKNALLCINKLAVLQSQFMFEENGSVCFEYVPYNRFGSKDRDRLTEIIRQELPYDLEIKIRTTSRLTRTSAGKSVSLVKF